MFNPFQVSDDLTTADLPTDPVPGISLEKKKKPESERLVDFFFKNKQSPIPRPSDFEPDVDGSPVNLLYAVLRGGWYPCSIMRHKPEGQGKPELVYTGQRLFVERGDTSDTHEYDVDPVNAVIMLRYRDVTFNGVLYMHAYVHVPPALVEVYVVENDHLGLHRRFVSGYKEYL